MASKLVAHLKSRIENDSSLAVLGHQWGFDKQLVPKALQNVGNLFTHYSRHDESHSNQILVNIERILGVDRIKQLTATDTWLLLEAAYWHDVGMIVTKTEYEQASKSEEFKEYLQSIKSDSSHSLNGLCSRFDFSSDTWKFETQLPYETVNDFKELFADWFRGKHASRASDVVASPWEKCGLSSPRTELIPNRLFLLLGRICEMHGCEFKELIADDVGLPYKEMGIGTEDCHPRYVAALLRLGDLLDLDDNRFCPVMVRIAGNDRPYTSLIHRHKHKSIRHFRLDSELIEITSVCNGNTLEENIDTYLESMNWFDWLENEIKSQMTNWTIIAPNKELGLLPTLGSIKVEFEDTNYFLPQKSRPEFGISIRKATDILQDLYTDQFVCIRELIQNSVDSTLLALHVNGKIDNNTSYNEVKSNIASNHTISVTFEQLPCVEEDIEVWDLTIVDKGTGISISDFIHMMKVGGSSENKYRRSLINKMPEIFKPSGTFGIGFQSIFLFADSVRIKTKSLFTDEKLEVSLYNPLGNKNGLCTFRRIDELFPYGAEIKAVLKINKKQLKNTQSENNKEFENFRATFDPLMDDENILHRYRIFDKVTDFSKYSLIPISAKYKSLDDTNYHDIDTFKVSPEDDNWNILQLDDVIFQYSATLSIENSGKHIFFKGQKINPPAFNLDNNSFYNTKFLEIKLNILSGDANEWLTAERKQIRSTKSDFLNEMFYLTIKDISKNNKSTNQNQIPILLSFVSYENIISGMDSRWNNLYKDHTGLWKNINNFSTKGVGVDNKKALIYHQNFMLMRDNFIENVNPSPKLNNKHDYDYIVITGNGTNFHNNWLTSVSYYKCIECGLNFKFDFEREFNAYNIEFGTDRNEITDEYLASLFLRNHIGQYQRPVIPFTDDMSEFKMLSIDFKRLDRQLRVSARLPTSKVLISPWIMRHKDPRKNISAYWKDRVEDFAHFLVNKKFIEGSADEAIELMDKLATYIDDKIRSSSMNSEWIKKTKS
ncbi:TPA: ATP-binding protein [Vibrio parahaemolyticus]|nr:ATP-binding protein [Vibrio parahaemolyticus]